MLELSLREAKRFGHNYIGTEHILLGLVREGEGVAAGVLVELGAELEAVRREVLNIIQGGPAAAEPAAMVRTVSVGPRCPACDGDLEESAAYRTLQVPEHDGAGRAEIQFVFCNACGATVGTISPS